MNKKKVFIIVAIVALILLIVVLTKGLKPKKADKLTAKEIKEDVKNNINDLTTTDLNYEKFKNIIGENVPNVHIALGKDSYLRNKPSAKVISKYNLTKYVNLQEQLAKKVEQRYLNSLNYKIKETIDMGDQICQKVEISSYYYALYLYDYLDLTNNMTDVGAEDAATNEKAQVEFYKNSVKALKVLDAHLDDYENTTKEKVEDDICYKNGKIDSDDMLGFVGALQGENYSNMNISSVINQNKAKERLAKYLEEAKNINI
ncbi:MAG: hypothetical protein IKG27_03490 [Bacilli bacterium]|nr:hypothetical protein [Bacilli bacterium]